VRPDHTAAFGVKSVMGRRAIVLVLLLGWPSVSGAHPQSQHPATEHQSTIPQALVGSWKAQPDRVPLSLPNGWGTEATAVRLTDLRITPDGSGRITVQRSVVNRAGGVLAGSRIVDSADFTVKAVEQPVGLRPYYPTNVMNAQRRDFTPRPVQTALDGLTLKIYSPSEGHANEIEISYELFDSEGSFSTTLERQRTGD
jgi:hypothetical protein